MKKDGKSHFGEDSMVTAGDFGDECAISIMQNNKIMTPSPIGHFYEDFTVGEVIKHELSKTIFESDNNLFSLLTMNNHPVHTNIDYASKNQHGKVLVVGTLVFSLAVGITVPDISGKAIANLGYEDVKHLAPTFRPNGDCPWLDVA